MNTKFFPVLLTIIGFLSMSLIIRHDVADQKYIELAKKYPQTCHLADGEGTLIKENWVLTAAHAAIVLQDQMENGRIPEVIVQNKKYKVKKVKLHPEFAISETGVHHDIALIQIDGFVKDVPIAKLYSKKDEKGKLITVVGRGDFGTGLTGPQKGDKITRAGTNKIDGTNKHYVYFTFDGPGSENVTPLEGISGPGDSGGPAFIDEDGERYIIGVSSHQASDEQEGIYGVIEFYTRVSAYKKWIEENMK